MISLTDSRTEMVSRAAEDVDHIFCGDCHTPGMPLMCGAPDILNECPEDCDHPTCPMCEIEWEAHLAKWHED